MGSPGAHFGSKLGSTKGLTWVFFSNETMKIHFALQFSDRAIRGFSKQSGYAVGSIFP